MTHPLLAILLLLPLSVTANASDITCSLTGKNEYSIAASWGKEEVREVNAVLSLDTQQINDVTYVTSYMADYIDDSAELYGVEVTNPDIEVSEKWITITEQEATSIVSNVDIVRYSRRISINRYSGVAVLNLSIVDKVYLGEEEGNRRRQDIALQGSCNANSERRF